MPNLISGFNYSCICSMTFFIVCFTVPSSANDFNFQKHIRQITIYRESEFRCGNDQYIDKSLVCDGIRDCMDGSDETLYQCENVTCPSYVFKCNYGACVEQRAKCDGRIDCVDQSDESPFVCEFQIPSQVNVCKDHQYQCFSEQCIDIKLLCDGKKDCRDGSDETFMRCHSTSCNSDRSFQCDYGACVDKSYRCDGTEQCIDGSDESIWTCKLKNNETTEHKNDTTSSNPNILQKKCDKLTPINVDLKCYRNGSMVNCNADLLAGTRVRPICKPFHTYKDLVPIYQEIICQDDGTWDYKLFSCIYECGRPFTILNTTSINNETTSEVRRVESPWHVGIYDKNKMLICAGTLISPYLILTAAHCFDGQITENIVTIDDNEILVSKMTKNYYTMDNGSQKPYKVKEVRLIDKGYIGGGNYYAADLAIIIVSKKITLDVVVQPACVDWIHTKKYQALEGTPGKLAGWEIGNTVNNSDTLLIRFLSFISRDRCFKKVPNGFIPYITNDKFCASSDDAEDSNAIPRTPGSGFLIREGSYYYIRGILSIKPSTDKYIATFTDLGPYVSWIVQVRNEVEKQMDKVHT